jgi:hypothetical protein
MSRNVRQTTKETIVTDSDTGVVMGANRQTVAYIPEDNFVKLYVERLPLIFGLPPQHGRILHGLLPKMNFDNEIVLKKGMKEEICRALDIKLNTLEHALGDLVKASILLRKGTGWYLVNPNIIGKGSWGRIREIRQTITWNYDGVKCVSQFINEPDAVQLKADL